MHKRAFSLKNPSKRSTTSSYSPAVNMHFKPPSTQKRANQMRVEFRMLSSNETISPCDNSVIQELITEVVDELGSVDGDILRLKKALSNLQIRRQELRSRLGRLKAGSHRKMPPELLTKIFRYCHDEAIQLPPHYAQSIWSISQVCSKWRNIAITDPLLWSRISIQTPHKQDPKLISLVDDIFRNRGGEGSMSYMIYINQLQEWQQTLDLICTYHSRFRKLELHFNATLDTSDLPVGASCGSHIIDVQSNIHITPPVTPWAHLTDICIFRITVPMFSLILSFSTLLLSCRVMVTGGRDSQDVAETPIRLKYLHMLDVMQEQCSGMNEFLARLVLPALKTFRAGCLQDWPQAGVMKMLKQSECTLETFETTYHVPPADLPLLMTAMPDLTTLKIYPLTPITETTLNEIREKNLAPKLCRLSGWEIQSLRPFVDLLQSRWTEPGKGIFNAIVRIRFKNWAPDEEYFRGILPEFSKYGRRIILNIY